MRWLGFSWLGGLALRAGLAGLLAWLGLGMLGMLGLSFWFCLLVLVRLAGLACLPPIPLPGLGHVSF